jgi:RNA polymerase sigma factor (sigma-70 family)
VQETLISVAKKMPGFTYNPAKDSFKGWLLTVTRWRVRDQFEKRRRGSILFQVPDPISPSDDLNDQPGGMGGIADPAGFDLEAIWDREWQKHLLQTALGRIRRQVHPRQYEIYHLHVVLGKPVEEVKKALQVSSAQVYLAKYRVGACLKRQLKHLQNGAFEFGNHGPR